MMVVNSWRCGKLQPIFPVIGQFRLVAKFETKENMPSGVIPAEGPCSAWLMHHLGTFLQQLS